ncbi:hypothetical protein DYBT9275_01840 [Dyadobacter sp. CECT 9275]|uniref:Competence protein ComEC n=1 Tax=Dyadobacter helix TaxID=2822344 RepID=A0A916JB01_9BACT|nr:ComEC/Rec2 family competence protein [Dyadobacter sp. CECT 9275]CAG4997734.1 hypothetical protein DYBT9275_01840 [Dyadobacter sp. CECT 9275]
MLSRAPFAGFVICYMAGLLLGAAFSVLTNWPLLWQVVGVILFFWVCLLFIRFQNRITAGIVVNSFLVTAGIFSEVYRNSLLREVLENPVIATHDAYVVIIKSLPEKRARSLRLEAETESFSTQGTWTFLRARAMISIPLDAEFVPRPGDRVLVKGQLEIPGAALNPYEFDYHDYLWNKGFVFADYWYGSSYRLVSSRSFNDNWRYLNLRVSEWADGVFRENMPDDRSYGLVKAMILGRRDDLRSGQVEDYTVSGTVHILSVSGLHVMVLFVVFGKLLGWLKKLKGGKYVYLALLMAILTFYALVTGLPPSVQRATLMSIVFLLAEVFGRKSEPVNTLALSAFLILLFDPGALYDIGFQLSYLAMLGIFLFFKPIQNCFSPRKKAVQYLWDITALSFAAQLATFPLSIFYFHQFPFYFWLINPAVILLTDLLLQGALVLLLASIFSIDWLQSAVSWLVDLCASLTNFFVTIPKNLPFYLVENLWLDIVEILLLYGLLGVVWLGYHYRSVRYFQLGTVITFVFVLYSLSVSVQRFYTPKGYIHSVPRHSVASFKMGDRLYILSDPDFYSDKSAYDFHLKKLCG